MPNKAKIALSVYLLFIASLLLFASPRASAAPVDRFQQLVNVVFAEPYTQLPYYKVKRSLFKNTSTGEPNRLLKDAKRTLKDRGDLLHPERGQKLLQANGICFVGQWRIDQQSDFTGLYAYGSQAPIIARASVSFSGTLQKHRRALGLAVKLMPEDLGSAASLNIFTLHSVGGVKTKHVLNLSMDNEPALGRLPSFNDIPTALKLKNVLLKADKQAGSKNPSVTYRTVAPLAAYNTLETAVAPRWLRFRPTTKARIDKADFRDELRVEDYPDSQLVYAIEVAKNEGNKKSKANWQTLGQLTLSKSITSKACDTRLHFAHPKN